jgi:hypothetical protein
VAHGAFDAGAPVQGTPEPALLLVLRRSCPYGHSGLCCAGCRQARRRLPIVLEELSAV